MRRFKSIYIIIPLIVLVFFAGVQPAYAWDWGDVFGWVGTIGGLVACPFTAGVGCLVAGGSAFTSGILVDVILDPIVTGLVQIVVDILTAVVTTISDILFRMAAAAVGMALHLNGLIQDSVIAREGFNIVLSFVNLGLVVAIVATAFMTMLRRGNAKRALFRFILVAILINFSFNLTNNFLIKPVNEITEVLVTAANFDGNSFASIFMPEVDWGGVGQEAYYKDAATVPPELPFGAKISIKIFGFLFYVTFVSLGVLSLFSFAIMLLVRYVAMIFLMVLMPIAWLAWIFPDLKIPGGHPTSLWWQQFTRWLFFPPIVVFFLFLSIRLSAVDNLGDLVTTQTSSVEKVAIAISNMLVVVGFMLGGLIAANKMSITGSKWGMGIAKKYGGKIKGWAAAKGRLYGWQAASAPSRSDIGKKATGWMQDKFGLKFAGRALNTLGAKGEQAIAKDAQAKIKTLSQNPERLAQAYWSLSGARRAEALIALSKKNLQHLIPGGPVRVMADASTKTALTRLGRGDDFEDVEKQTGMNQAIALAALAYQKSPGDTALKKKLDDAIAAFSEDRYQSSKDINLLRTRAFRGKAEGDLNEDTMKYIARGLGLDLLQKLPGATANKIRTNAKAQEYGFFQEIFDEKINNFEEQIKMPAVMRGHKADTKAKLDEVEKGVGGSRAEEKDKVWARQAYPAWSRNASGLFSFSSGPASAPTAPTP